MVKKFFTLNCFFVVMILISIFFTACSLKYLPHGELIDTTVSPNNEYVVNAYLCSGNATTDFSVRCEVVDYILELSSRRCFLVLEISRCYCHK